MHSYSKIEEHVRKVAKDSKSSFLHNKAKKEGLGRSFNSSMLVGLAHLVVDRDLLHNVHRRRSYVFKKPKNKFFSYL